MKEGMRDLLIAGGALTGTYFIMKAAASCCAEDRSIDDDNPYIDADSRSGGGPEKHQSLYEAGIKTALDQILSFSGLIILSPVYAAIALAIIIDDPGPVFFTQKRVGKDGRFFMLHKYRSMKLSAPHEIPTHQLRDPGRYITRVGRVLRRSSLDELPQIWDIFRGRMSVVGPRPALWNQYDLVAERAELGANSPMPGLTGLAQIRGRDELGIADKAAADGEYARVLRAGGWKAFVQDVLCFFGTVSSVIRHDGVAEGGTGSSSARDDHFRLHKKHRVPPALPADAGFEDYGYKKNFSVDKERKIRMLVTGAGSYIGESFRAYAGRHYPGISITVIDMMDDSWKGYDFSQFDTVFHVAGIAHADTGRINRVMIDDYYAVNTGLAVETAEKCRDEGVRQFIFLSSMIIYGDPAPIGKSRVIDESTVPSPAGFYGDSKWQADKGVRKLSTPDFHVAVLRLPMVYGRGSRGNYKILAEAAVRSPVFPDIKNERSMLYIENLCEFAAQLALTGEGGIYFPQNSTYAKTGSMAEAIGAAADKPVRISRIWNPAVFLASCVPGKPGKLVNKAFGSIIYDQKLSRYEGISYQKVSLEASIAETEGSGAAGGHGEIQKRGKQKMHILVVSQYFYPEAFRINDMAAEWVRRGYRVTVLTGIPNYPEGRFFKGYGYRHRRHEQWNGVEIIRLPLVPRGKSRIGMAANYFSFAAGGWLWKMTSGLKADLVFTYEVSPMTQALAGCFYAEKHHIPHFLYVQDLWPENVETAAGIRSPFIIKPIDKMADYIYGRSDKIFTTSPSFAENISSRGVDKSKIHYWPQYAEEFYKPLDRDAVRAGADDVSPVRLIPDDGRFHIIYTGNIGTAQGLEILPEAAEKLRDSNIRFIIAGGGCCRGRFEEEIKKRKVDSMFILISRQPAETVPLLLSCCDAAFLSFADAGLWEMTIPAKLQSYMACGMPVVAAAQGETERIIKEAQCGVCCKTGDVQALVEAVNQIMSEDLSKLGSNSRLYAESHFDKTLLMDEMDRFIACEMELNS